ncbi:low molecular weight phosphatase family protein [Natronolimnohabitans sp. A-GB9]|uniref:arsenate-mycothiol transferase ArsC n=1 Tax=Natronolimnohabitans sp. A-GB9 TaxID=3069757 RepID=UPI0027B5301E|nr:low molecular weight phosphatase family protein [Natronolimnohabitans sp. A-GB9]MDQ2051066.1 low molecular weight phosphatase family protein [Natronolimnohabitans sp. A-GB9]
MTDDAIHVGFVCVQNAGRSQMATAFAERERDRRGWDDRIEIHTGGTHPAEEVHPVVVDAMAEVGIDLAQRTPREIPDDELAACDVVATMGCSTLEFEADDVDVRDWALDDPHGEALERVREIRSTVETRVQELFDDLESKLGGDSRMAER